MNLKCGGSPAKIYIKKLNRKAEEERVRDSYRELAIMPGRIGEEENVI
jgi:hypothetical protein